MYAKRKGDPTRYRIFGTACLGRRCFRPRIRPDAKADCECAGTDRCTMHEDVDLALKRERREQGWRVE